MRSIETLVNSTSPDKFHLIQLIHSIRLNSNDQNERVEKRKKIKKNPAFFIEQIQNAQPRLDKFNAWLIHTHIDLVPI